MAQIVTKRRNLSLGPVEPQKNTNSSGICPLILRSTNEGPIDLAVVTLAKGKSSIPPSKTASAPPTDYLINNVRGTVIVVSAFSLGR